MNYRWLDPLGRGHVDNHIGATRWNHHRTILCSPQIWEIFTEVENCGERLQNLRVFNSSEKIAWRLEFNRACRSCVLSWKQRVMQVAGRPAMHRRAQGRLQSTARSNTQRKQQQQKESVNRLECQSLIESWFFVCLPSGGWTAARSRSTTRSTWTRVLVVS